MKAIFEEGIATGQATFEAAAPSWKQWDGAHFGGLVAEDDDEVVGWTALTRYSSRPSYAGVAEESVYVAARARRGGIGRRLLAAQIEAPSRPGSGRSRPGSFRRTAPASRCTWSSGSA